MGFNQDQEKVTVTGYLSVVKAAHLVPIRGEMNGLARHHGLWVQVRVRVKV